jgi:hypothetical protein
MNGGGTRAGRQHFTQADRAAARDAFPAALEHHAHPKRFRVW